MTVSLLAMVLDFTTSKQELSWLAALTENVPKTVESRHFSCSFQMDKQTRMEKASEWRASLLFIEVKTFSDIVRRRFKNKA